MNIIPQSLLEGNPSKYLDEAKDGMVIITEANGGHPIAVIIRMPADNQHEFLGDLLNIDSARKQSLKANDDGQVAFAIENAKPRNVAGLDAARKLLASKSTPSCDLVKYFDTQLMPLLLGTDSALEIYITRVPDIRCRVHGKHPSVYSRILVRNGYIRFEIRAGIGALQDPEFKAANNPEFAEVTLGPNSPMPKNLSKWIAKAIADAKS